MLYGSTANFAQFYLCFTVFVLIQYLYVGSLAYRTFAPAMGYQCTNPFTPMRF